MARRAQTAYRSRLAEHRASRSPERVAAANGLRRLAQTSPPGGFTTGVRTMSRVTVALDGPPPYFAIGLISGTSHDGISAALVALDERRTPPLRLLAARSFPYPSAMRAR